MKPVFQRHTDVSKPEMGDCLTACIASVLELPLEAVPHFCHPDVPDWLIAVRDFLQPWHLYPIEIKLSDPGFKPYGRFAEGAILIIHGDSPRGKWQHSVVGEYDTTVEECYRITHDPNPAGGGIVRLRGFMAFGSTNPALRRS